MGDGHQEKKQARKPSVCPKLSACGHGLRLVVGIKKGPPTVVDGPFGEMVCRDLEGPAAADLAGGIDETTRYRQANPEARLG